MIMTPELIDKVSREIDCPELLDACRASWDALESSTKQRIYDAIRDVRYGNGARYKSIDGVQVNDRIYD